MNEPMSKARAAALLLRAREDVAAVLQSNLETHAELIRLIGITGELYEAIAKAEPPEISITARAEKVG